MINEKFLTDSKTKLCDTDIIIPKEKIILIDDIKYKKTLPSKILNFIRNNTINEFPYPQLDQNKFKREFNNLCNINEEVGKNIILNSGNSFLCTTSLKSFYKNIYTAKKGKSPMSSYERFYDDESLLKVLNYRCGLNNSKLYEYKINGNIIKSQETFDICNKNIRIGINSYFYCEPSVFSTLLAKIILNTAIEKTNKNNIIIYDPFGGWGSRMIAAAAFQNKSIHYIYNDASQKTCEYSNNLYNYIKENLNINFSCNIEKKPFNENNISNYDILLTCPPYQDLEKYDENIDFDIDGLLKMKKSYIIYNKLIDKFNKPFKIYSNKSHYNKNSDKCEYLYIN